MKMRKRKVKAYFTVEASLVLPIVIGSIIFVICFLLYWSSGNESLCLQLPSFR